MDGRKYVSIAYKKAAELANVEEHVLTHQMRAIKGAIKGRIRFLSKDSPTDYFKFSRGGDVAGVSHARQCYHIPKNVVPNEFLGNCFCFVTQGICLMYAYYHDNLKNQIGGEGDYNNKSNEEKENHALPLFCKNCIIHSPFHLFK